MASGMLLRKMVAAALPVPSVTRLGRQQSDDRVHSTRAKSATGSWSSISLGAFFSRNVTPGAAPVCSQLSMATSIWSESTKNCQSLRILCLLRVTSWPKNVLREYRGGPQPRSAEETADDLSQLYFYPDLPEGIGAFAKLWLTMGVAGRRSCRCLFVLMRRSARRAVAA